jgi:hypothetical protein
MIVVAEAAGVKILGTDAGNPRYLPVNDLLTRGFLCVRVRRAP